MRKVYMIDLGLLIAAGTIAVVLTTKPVASQVAEAGPDQKLTSSPTPEVVVQESSRTTDQQEAHAETVSAPDR